MTRLRKVLVDSVAILMGMRVVRVDRPGGRRAVGLWSLGVAGLALVPLPGQLGVFLGLACLPLARAQAATLWWTLIMLRRTEGMAARLAPDRELLHKMLWALLLAVDLVLVLGRRATELWADAPIGFLAFAAPLLPITGICLIERAFGSGLRRRARGWTWLGVQAAAAWEEVLYRGLLMSLLWPLFFGSSFWAILLGAILFAIPHYERGRPSGLRGVGITFALGVACILPGLWTGSILAGFLMHGGVLGSIGVLRCQRLRDRERGDLDRDSALFLIRLRHGYYVVDWEGDRIRRLADPASPLATCIRQLIVHAGEPAALPSSELNAVRTSTKEAHLPGPQWFHRWEGFLVVATPEGSLPPPFFPSMSLRILHALRRSSQVSA